MIEMIREEKIYSHDYQKIRLEFIDIWNKLFLKRKRIDGAAFGKLRLFAPLIKALPPVLLHYYLKVMPNFEGSLLDYGLILRSNQLWSVRNWEYPWAILNSKLDSDMKILDIGSGWSLFPLYLAKSSNHVESVDTSGVQMNAIAPMLADILGCTISYYVDDALGLSAKDDTYDYVYCISVLEHLEEERENGVLVNKHSKQLDRCAMRECLRVVKPGGRVVLTMQYGNENSDMRSFTFDYFKDLMEEFKDNLLKPVDSYEPFRFTTENEEEMSRVIANCFPYEPTSRPTGSIGVVLTK